MKTITRKFSPTELAAVRRRMEQVNSFIANLVEAHGNVFGSFKLLPDGTGYTFTSQPQEDRSGEHEQQPGA